MDLSAVNHNLLLSILTSFGTTVSYLKQCPFWILICSMQTPCSGAPQGSVLRSFPFSYYACSLGDVIPSTHTQLIFSVKYPVGYQVSVADISLWNAGRPVCFISTPRSLLQNVHLGISTEVLVFGISCTTSTHVSLQLGHSGSCPAS